MSNKIVFDTSAILTLIKMEQGHETVAKHLDNAIVSSVNFSEVATILAREGFGQDEVIRSLSDTFLHIIDFDSEQAVTVASLDEFTRHYNLSFGDKACLALAKFKNLPVLTSNKLWQNLDLNIETRTV